MVSYYHDDTVNDGPLLPVELCEHILDFVWPDRITLLSCALVCRAWLPRGRLNLLHQVRLRDRTQAWSLSSFLSRHAVCCSSVRVLQISPRYSGWTLTRAFPLLFVGKLSHVEHIRLENRCGFNFFAQPRSLTALGQFVSVRKLEIRGYMLPSLHSFGRLITALPNITTLICRTIRWSTVDYSPESFRPVSARLKLTTMAMSDIRWYDELVDMLADIVDLRSLPTLNIQSVQMQELQPVNRLIDAVGSALRHLVLSPSAFPTLTSNVNLRTLRLHFHDRGEWIVPMLSQLASEPRPFLALRISNQEILDEESLRLLRLDRLAKIVAQHRLNPWELVFCHKRSIFGVDEYHAEVRRCLPDAAARGLLRIEPSEFVCIVRPHVRESTHSRDR
ncbi:uncharacterized protein B0H18DRAFT_889120 [Fomitopsis serialis]|uniref:uncharacterized protein n=1 Tax=Fomitopsis serialis TaxID=139415 RepID=UPI0020076852|nr:uncharacterized protein B0H18DRAFT_889120 [Neoantrodia serialis]KAH9912899.1 hypothetical protein B0H18DRAFT_889120 [Neoantrodia serialis]